MPDYEFYQSVYHGSSIPVEEWPGCAERAREQLEQYKRIYTVTVPKDMPDGEERAVCAMAEAIYSFDLLANGEGGPVQSASIGSVSVSYGGAVMQAVDLSPQGQGRELYRIARRYLDFYRGVR